MYKHPRTRAAERALLQVFGPEAAKEFIGEGRTARDRLAGLKKIAELEAIKKFEGVELFLIDYDPAQPGKKLRVFSWPGQKKDPLRLTFIQRTLRESVGIIEGYGLLEQFSQVLQGRSMGVFPGLLVSPNVSDKINAFYCLPHNFCSMSILGRGLEAALVVHEWGHQMLHLMGYSLPFHTRQDRALAFALDEAGANTLQYVGAYAACLRGNRKYWDQLVSTDVSSRFDLPQDYASRLLKIADQNPEWKERIKAGVVPMDFTRAVFKEFALNPMTFHIDYYTKEAGFLALPATGLSLGDEDIQRNMPFGRDDELLQGLKSADFVNQVASLDGAQSYSAVLAPQREKRHAEELYKHQLREFKACAAEIATHRNQGYVGKLAEAFIDFQSGVARLGEVPQALLDAFEFKDRKEYDIFIRELREEARRDVIAEFGQIQKDLLSLRSRSRREVEGLVNKMELVGYHNLSEQGFGGAVNRVLNWEAFHSFVGSKTQYHAKVVVNMLLENGLTLANFQPLGSTATPTVFAKTIGLYQAVAKMDDWTFGTVSGRDEVLSRIGIEPNPKSLELRKRRRANPLSTAEHR